MIAFLKEKDKQLHMAVTAVITFFSGALIWSLDYSIFYGAFMAMFVGVGKELSDSKKGGTGFDKRDIIADVIGTSFGLGVLYLFTLALDTNLI